MANLLRVLMVAEKPSIALSIASVLSHGQMSTRRGSTEVHEFDGMFRGFKAHYRVTSVIGHVFRFSLAYQSYSNQRVICCCIITLPV
jgi:DNA topoisomerase-3